MPLVALALCVVLVVSACDTPLSDTRATAAVTTRRAAALSTPLAVPKRASAASFVLPPPPAGVLTDTISSTASATPSASHLKALFPALLAMLGAVSAVLLHFRRRSTTLAFASSMGQPLTEAPMTRRHAAQTLTALTLGAPALAARASETRPVITDRVYFKVRISRADSGPPEERPFAGTVVFGLYGEDAPQSAARFRAFAGRRRPNYQQSAFYRMQQGLLLEAGRIAALAPSTLNGTPVLQYGDQVLDTALATPAQDTNFIRHDRRGLLTHAVGEPTAEFAITLGPNGFLDPSHVVFGEVLEGQDFLDRVEQVPVLRDASPGPVGDFLRAQKQGYRRFAELIGDDRAKKVYENKLMRRVDVAECGVLEPGEEVAMFATSGAQVPRLSPLNAMAKKGGETDILTEGTPIKVCKSVLMYHVPKAGGQPVDLMGASGTVVQTITTYEGANITPNYPVRARIAVEVPGAGPQTVVCHLDRAEVERA